MPKYRTRGIAKRQRQILYAKIGAFFVLFCLIASVCSWLSHKEKINIRNIIVAENVVAPTEDILKIANQTLEGNYLRLFSKRNILFYPKSKIKTELLNSFLRIKAVDIQFADFQSININILERMPYAIWCAENHLTLQAPSNSLGVWSAKREEKCYFMDENAFLFDAVPEFSEKTHFKYYGGDIVATATDKILGQTFLMNARKGQFEKVNLFIRYLKDINIEGNELMVWKNGDYELLFGNDSKLIFDADQDFDEIFENLHATLIDLGDLTGKEFEYIDLRFNNKVLYKFREQL